MIDISKDVRFMTNNFLETGAVITTSSEDEILTKANLTTPDRNHVFKFGGKFSNLEGNKKLYINGYTFLADLGSEASLQEVVDTTFSAWGNPPFIPSIVYDNVKGFGIKSDVDITLNLDSRDESLWDALGFTSEEEVSADANEVIWANEFRSFWPHEFISVDFGYQAKIGFVGIISGLDKEVSIPAGSSVRFQGSTVPSWDAPAFDIPLTWDRRGLFRFLDDQNYPPCRYVRILFDSPISPRLPEIGYLYVGDYTKLPNSRNVSTGMEFYDVDPTLQSESDYGVIYSNPKPSYRVYESLQVGLAKPAQVAFLKDIFQRKKKNLPFFFCLDPKAYLDPDPLEHLKFVKFVDSPRYKHILRNVYEIGFSLREVV